MTDREYLLALKTFIERTQVILDYDWGARRNIEQIIADGHMPVEYDETLRRIAALES